MFLHTAARVWGHRWCTHMKTMRSFVKTASLGALDCKCMENIVIDLIRLNLPCSPFYINLNEICLHGRDPNAPRTLSKPGVNQWQHSIRDWEFRDLNLLVTMRCTRIRRENMHSTNFEDFNEIITKHLTTRKSWSSQENIYSHPWLLLFYGRCVFVGNNKYLRRCVHITNWTEKPLRPISELWVVTLRFFNTLRSRRNGRHLADDIFKCIFSNENAWPKFHWSLSLRTQAVNPGDWFYPKTFWRMPTVYVIFDLLFVFSFSIQQTFDIVQQDFALADKENFAIGLKPVLGAYIDEVSLIDTVSAESR